jgi:ATP-dependent RNA helicase DDX51/DBP6
LAQVLASTQPKPSGGNPISKNISTELSTVDALAPAFIHHQGGPSVLSTALDENRKSSCQKLLFSATLTRDPSKIAALNLREPKYFIVQTSKKEAGDDEEYNIMDVVMEKFTMPASLKVSCLSLLLCCFEHAYIGTYGCLRNGTKTHDPVSPYTHT